MFPLQQTPPEMNNAEYGFSEQISLFQDNMMGTELDLGLLGNVLEGGEVGNNNHHLHITDEYSLHRQMMRNEVENNEMQIAIQNSMIMMNGGQIRDEINNNHLQTIQGNINDQMGHELLTIVNGAQIGTEFNMFPFQMTGTNMVTSHQGDIGNDFNVLPFQNEGISSIPFHMTMTGENSLKGGEACNGNILYGADQMGNDLNNHYHLTEVNTFTGAQMAGTILRDEDSESRLADENREGPNMSDALSSDSKQKHKGKKYNRHTNKQIEELEGLFKDYPHPSDRQRKQLANQLGMNPLQVKFWFQNRRTQAKAMQERHEGNKLRQRMQVLEMENLRFREALSSATCLQCGGSAITPDTTVEEQKLRLEVCRLRSEIERLNNLATKCIGKPISNEVDNASAPVNNSGGDCMVDNFRSLSPPTEAERQVMMDLAVSGTEELMMLTRIDEPLWRANLDGTFSLDEDEYLKTFPVHSRTKPTTFKFEATRECVIVMMSHVALVEMLMDTNQWSNMFTSIVSRVASLNVPTPGLTENYDGALQVMTADYHVPSPLVPMHESYFLRFSKLHPTGIWTIVDVSLDQLRPNVPITYHRRPSGCLIQELPDGYAKITWLEHVGVESSAIHNLYKPIISTGLAFSAKRWASVLYQQCERLVATAMNLSPNDFNHMVMIDPEAGRKCILKLGERMVKGFYQGLRASYSERWMSVPGSVSGDIKIMSHTNVNDQGRPLGVALIATTSIWLPVSPKRMFNYIQNENLRSSWDVLTGAINLQQVAHIASSGQPGDCVSLFRQSVSTAGEKKNMLMIQECFYDPISSYLVYAPVDITAMNMVLSGALTPESAALLPSGFAIMPDGPLVDGAGQDGIGSGGVLLTIAFQILVDAVPTYKVPSQNVDLIHSLVMCAIDRIKAMVARNNG